MQKTISVPDRERLARVLGVYDRNLRAVRDRTGARIFTRDGEIHISGSRGAVQRAADAIEGIVRIVDRGRDVSDEELDEVLSDRPAGRSEIGFGGRPGIFRPVQIEPRTEGQRRYFLELDRCEITFVIGPAGTGKTFLAVVRAVAALQAGLVRRIVLVRPAVEAGERLGFLPGDIEAKVNPYLRPIYDALNFCLEFGQLRRLIEQDVIEIAPLAYMRGRTLDEAFVLLDEAQNTTSEQMKMFLTRMGQKSRFVVTGDITQIDLPAHRPSGLVEARTLLRAIPGIGWVELTREDIVRHPLVQRVVDAYERKRPR